MAFTGTPSITVSLGNWPTGYSDQSHSASASASGTTGALTVFGQLGSACRIGGGPDQAEGLSSGTTSATAVYTIAWSPDHVGDVAPSTIQVQVKRAVKSYVEDYAQMDQPTDGIVWCQSESDLDVNFGSPANEGVGSISDSGAWDFEDLVSTNGNESFKTFYTGTVTLTKNAGSNTYTLSVASDVIYLQVNTYLNPAPTYGDAVAGSTARETDQVTLTILNAS